MCNKWAVFINNTNGKKSYIVFFWTHRDDVPTRLVGLRAHSNLSKRRRYFSKSIGNSKPNTYTLHSNEQ